MTIFLTRPSPCSCGGVLVCSQAGGILLKVVLLRPGAEGASSGGSVSLFPQEAGGRLAQAAVSIGGDSNPKPSFGGSTQPSSFLVLLLTVPGLCQQLGNKGALSGHRLSPRTVTEIYAVSDGAAHSASGTPGVLRASGWALCSKTWKT